MIRAATLPVLIAALASAGCDPGLFYKIPGARFMDDGGRHFLVDVDQGVESGFYASVFIFGGNAEVRVVNRSATPIEFDLSPTEIRDAKGTVIPTKCELAGHAKPVIISSGQLFTVRCGFTLRPKGTKFYDQEQYILMISQPGFSQKGKPLSIVAAMQAAG